MEAAGEALQWLARSNWLAPKRWLKNLLQDIKRSTLKRFFSINHHTKEHSSGGAIVDHRIYKLKRYLTGRFCDQLSIEELAARVNLSPSRLSHLFKRETGVPTLEFLKQIRMYHARTLLEDTFLSVKEIMALCGFNDASHFIRDFERVHGKTPRRYREYHLESGHNFCSGPGQRIAEEANELRLSRRPSPKHTVIPYQNAKTRP